MAAAKFYAGREDGGKIATFMSRFACPAFHAVPELFMTEGLMSESLMQNDLFRFGRLAGLLVLAAMMFSGPARADKIKHPIAVFSGLDKITGRTIAFQASAGETVQFGSLQITERACYTSPATEAPQTVSFVEVDEIDADKKYKRIFSGWMFAASPGLHGIEHPIYDIWLTDCAGASSEAGASASLETPAAAPPPPDAAPETPQSAAPDQKKPPRKGHQSKKREPAVVEPLGEVPPQDQGSADAPPLEAPIEVAPPPGFVPAPQGNRRPPAQGLPAQDY